MSRREGGGGGSSWHKGGVWEGAGGGEEGREGQNGKSQQVHQLRRGGQPSWGRFEPPGLFHAENPPSEPQTEAKIWEI